MARTHVILRGSRVAWFIAARALAVTATVPARWTPAQDAAASLRFLPADAIAAVIAYPRQVAALPDMELLPKELISADGMKELGFDPLEIESMVAFAEAPGPNGPPGFGAVIRLAKPYDRQSLLPQILAGTEPGTIKQIGKQIGDTHFSQARLPDRGSQCEFAAGSGGALPRHEIASRR